MAQLDIAPYSGDVSPEGTIPEQKPTLDLVPVTSEEDVPFVNIDAELEQLKKHLPKNRAEVGAYYKKKADLERTYDKLMVDRLLKQWSSGGSYDDSSNFDAQSVGAFVKAGDLKGRSDLFSEQWRKFKDVYPNGSLVPVETRFGGTIFIGRTNPNEPYRKVGSWRSEAASALVSEPALGALAAGVTASTAGLGLVPSMLLVGTGAALGSIAQYKIEQARGYQDSPWTTMAKDAASEFLVNAVFEPFGTLITGAKGEEALLRAKNKAKFANLMKETGIPIFKGEAAGALWRAVYDVTRPLSTRAQRNEANRMFQMREQLIARRAGETANVSPSALSDQQLRQAAIDQRFEVMAANGLTPTGMTKQELGVAVRSAEDKLDSYLTEMTDRLYKYSSKAADDELTSFSLSNLHKKIADMKEGRFLYKKPETTVVDDIPITTQGMQQTNVPFADPRLAKLVEEIEALDPTVVANPKNNAFVALMDLRARAGNIMMETKDGASKAEATAIWGELSDALRKPLGGSPDFLNRWSVANDTYHQAMIWRRAKETRYALGESNDAEAIAAQYLQPNQYDTLMMLKKQLDTMVADPLSTADAKRAGASAWEKLRRGYFVALTGSDDALLNAPEVMAKMGPEQLDLMVDPPVQRAIIQASENLNQLKAGPIQDLLKKNRTQAERFALMASNRDVTQAELEAFVTQLGGRDSEAAAGIRAAIWDKLVEDASVRIKSEAGQEASDPRKLSSKINELFKSGRVDALFSNADKKAFEKWQEVLAVVQKANSLGAQEATAETAVEFTPRNMMNGGPGYIAKFAGIIGNDWMGGLMSKPINVEKILAAAEGNDVRHILKNVLRVQTNLMLDLKQQAWTAQNSLNEIAPYDYTKEDVKALQDRYGDSPPPTVGSSIIDWLGGAANSAKEYIPFMGSSPQPTPPPSPAPGQQGSLQPAPRTGIMTTNMAQTMPPRPAPAMAQPSPAQGSKYAALFPNDSLGTLAASGGIASLTG